MNYIAYLKSSKCPECFHTNIKYDYIKKERFCNHCGLIIQSQTPTTRKQIEYITNKIKNI